MAIFNIRLRECLAERGMTQAELAKATGITEAAISRYAGGSRSPNMKQVARIADALHVSFDQLFEMEGCTEKNGTNDLTRLKPCPFCGGPVRYNYNLDLDPDGIACHNCHIVVRFPRVHVREHDKYGAALVAMAEAWNRRAT